MIGASRSELLEWINVTFDLNYTKVEQCGNGAAYCLIFQSIFNDLPISKLKLQPNQDYQTLNNYKILQSGFNKHKISREVPVDRLMKCRLQDNLEFLQWMSKLWSDNNGGSIDTSNMSISNDSASNLSSSNPRQRTTSTLSSRRPLSNSTASSSTTTTATRKVSGSSISSSSNRSRNSSNPTSLSTTSNPTRSRVTPGSTTSSSIGVRSRIGASSLVSNKKSLPSSTSQRQQQQQQQQHHVQQVKSSELLNEIEALRSNNNEILQELQEYKLTTEGLETERNFYFNKLRDIEIICQNLSDKRESGESNGDISVDDLVNKIQEILYSTEEGFQVPDIDNELDDNNHFHEDNKENTHNDGNNIINNENILNESLSTDVKMIDEETF
ncbi:unnamed protein product [[Candida] boidinii]|uniref:Unnamed protein product n=1 Tax=Candida boidinii TaxID=5477 RepID=A0A9W6T1Y2_CANBO|nr:hypothetical protein B5S30_g5225 [[Candida] boidinii]OWB86804.1 hypothetical protein B5S33_g5518 [[Candida] boidinii]GME74171.1 unnamed protein product [[Candida] boidinii]GMG12633.1 unnamed protein product [[Candida] boidinii]